MKYLLLPGISFVFYIYLTCAGLPFVALADKLRAVRQGRAVFVKSAGQLVQLAALLQAFTVLALLADLALHGYINCFMQDVWRPVWLGSIALSALALFFSILASLACKSKKASGAPFPVCLVLSGVAALTGVALAFICVLIFLHGGNLSHLANGASLASSLAVLLASVAKFPLALFALACLVLAWVGAEALALVWYLILRRRDDFGRDYYSLMLRSHAKQAAILSGLVLLPLTICAFIALPEISALRLPQVLPWAANVNMATLWGGAFCLPLALVCWLFLSKAQLPLRKKALAIAAVPLVWFWFFSLLARIWV